MDMMEIRRKLLDQSTKKIGGLPVLIDNAWFPNWNGYANSYRASNNYFITGVYDTGSTSTKSYTWYQAPRTSDTGGDYPAFRVFNDLSAQSVDFWGCATGEAQPTVRQGSSPGRYILFSVRKSYAADTYMYDDTNSRYVFKGANKS